MWSVAKPESKDMRWFFERTFRLEKCLLPSRRSLGNELPKYAMDQAGSTMRYMDASISLGTQKVRFDREATIELYRRTIAVPGADSCDCLHCRNFAKQRQDVYPAEFKTLLDRLGADPTKEWEVYELGSCTTKPNHRLYGGWFLFCGELVDGTDAQAEGLPFSFHFTESFPNGTLPE